ncbi:MAG: RagB/SusD family nutrient uptake outer membrane protein [Bacteroidales bacterium]
MAAEALNENDNPDDALLYLNEVRRRARQGNDAILLDITETGKVHSGISYSRRGAMSLH